MPERKRFFSLISSLTVTLNSGVPVPVVECLISGEWSQSLLDFLQIQPYFWRIDRDSIPEYYSI